MACIACPLRINDLCTPDIIHSSPFVWVIPQAHPAVTDYFEIDGNQLVIV